MQVSPCPPGRMSNRPAKGLTLVELMVVVSILIIMISILVPMMRPIMQGRKQREAARQLSVFISGAQARAAAQGKPVGIWIERFAHELTDPPEKWYTAYNVYLAEVPQAYAGDLIDSRVFVQQNAANPALWEARFSPSCCDSALQNVKQGDLLQFDHGGPLYPIQQVAYDRAAHTGLILFGVPPTLPPAMSPAKYIGRIGGVAFNVTRRPTKSTTTPVTLPNNVAIDLSLSGFPPALARFRELHPEYDVVIMFSPDGGLDRIHYISHEEDIPTFSETPVQTVSLLIARDDRIGRDSLGNVNLTTDLAANANGPLGEGTLADQSNVWLSISPHSGRVATAPNAGLPVTSLRPLPAGTDARTLIPHARQYADTGQTMGGR